jgi:hypothetical protein
VVGKGVDGFLGVGKADGRLQKQSHCHQEKEQERAGLRAHREDLNGETFLWPQVSSILRPLPALRHFKMVGPVERSGCERCSCAHAQQWFLGPQAPLQKADRHREAENIGHTD